MSVIIVTQRSWRLIAMTLLLRSSDIQCTMLFALMAIQFTTSEEWSSTAFHVALKLLQLQLSWPSPLFHGDTHMLKLKWFPLLYGSDLANKLSIFTSLSIYSYIILWHFYFWKNLSSKLIDYYSTIA